MSVFFDHSRHTLWVSNVAAQLDVLAFEGNEQLSQSFTYCVEFTSTDLDLAAESMLQLAADFLRHSGCQRLTQPSVPADLELLRPLDGVGHDRVGFRVHRLSGLCRCASSRCCVVRW